jgi:hypothetical protein
MDPHEAAHEVPPIPDHALAGLIDTPSARRDPLARTLMQAEEGIQERQRQRMLQSFQILKQDRLEVVYEVEAIRKTEERLEHLVQGIAPEVQDPAFDREAKIAELRERLGRLRQGQQDSLAAENPRFTVVIVKPTVTEKEQLGLIERKVVAEEARRAYVEHAPFFRESLREALRTTTLMDGLANSEAEVHQSIKATLIDMLLGLEGRQEAQIRNVSDFDPELALTDEEEESIAPLDTLDPADLAEAALNQERRRTALLAQKRQKLIRARLAEAEEHRAELAEETTEALIEKITQLEVLNVAISASKEAAIDYWLLQCVRDAQQPLQGYARGTAFTKGWEPFFNSVEEVRDVKEGFNDFYTWLIAQRSRLDALTEEDLYALAAYAPFHEVLRSLRGAGGEPDAVAAVPGLFR